jgi:hypothetical protein
MYHYLDQRDRIGVLAKVPSGATPDGARWRCELTTIGDNAQC